MSVFNSYYALTKTRNPDSEHLRQKLEINTYKNKQIPEKNLLDIVEKKIDEVFSNMKKRKSNTNFQIDYPWLTI